MQTNDELWKGALEDFAIEFIQKFYPQLYPYLDPDRPIEFLDKELAQLAPDSEDGKRIVDKLMKVYLIGQDEPRIIYIHNEVQGYSEDKFDERSFIYFYRLFDRFKGNITTRAIYTDTRKRYKPSVFKYECYGTKMTYEMPFCKVLDEDPNVLAASENLFDTVLLTTYWAIQRKRKALSEEDMMNLKLDLMRRLLVKDVPKEKIRRLLAFIKGYLRLEKPKNKFIFEQKYDELLNFEKNMGITEILIKQGREEGRQEGRQEALTEAQVIMRESQKNTTLNMRKIGFSAEKIADIINCPLEDVLAFFKEADDNI